MHSDAPSQEHEQVLNPVSEADELRRYLDEVVNELMRALGLLETSRKPSTTIARELRATLLRVQRKYAERRVV